MSTSYDTKKAILVVSFGTSFENTRKVTIDAIEQDIAQAYPDYRIYRAWTSKMILKKLKKRDGIHYDNVKEAMQRMASDGITDVVIQPTHVINGIENDLMTEDALEYADLFHTIHFGTPLLTSIQDNDRLIAAIHEEFQDLTSDEVLVLMGHGTAHFANAIYAALDYTFKDKGYPNIFLGTVEAYPSMDSLLHMVQEYNPKRIVLAPFMIVAGDHATNDMAGEDPDSWRCQFEAAGYPVTCVLKGLGEYPQVRKLLVEHVADAI
ncbi:MAG: sirohydrochlorin cobaltochelatase [Lachnospiraceae bacterium]|nr:sirohydrochlorin cobaltochelatase [Lachnospiraceae bacterium]